MSERKAESTVELECRSFPTISDITFDAREYGDTELRVGEKKLKIQILQPHREAPFSTATLLALLHAPLKR